MEITEALDGEGSEEQASDDEVLGPGRDSGIGSGGNGRIDGSVCTGWWEGRGKLAVDVRSYQFGVEGLGGWKRPGGTTGGDCALGEENGRPLG